MIYERHSIDFLCRDEGRIHLVPTKSRQTRVKFLAGGSYMAAGILDYFYHVSDEHDGIGASSPGHRIRQHRVCGGSTVIHDTAGVIKPRR